MIIDTHLHLGKQGPFRLEYDQLLRQMNKNGIRKGIVSTVACAEYRPDVNQLLPEQYDQLEANRELLEQCRGSNGRLYLSFWCKPATAPADGIYDFVRENRELVKGLKFHPFYSRMPLEDPRYEPYLDIARELKLPVSVHTAADDLSSPEQLLAMAKRHREVDFIMVHLGLCSDNEVAITCLAQADNLYGDTTWVPIEKVRKAMKLCGSEKLLFGSDAPIDAEKSYDFYRPMLRSYRLCPWGAWADVMHRNARRLFDL
jgi:predicted TIM-barrel fold metal-dependent hydrolase